MVARPTSSSASPLRAPFSLDRSPRPKPRPTGSVGSGGIVRTGVGTGVGFGVGLGVAFGVDFVVFELVFVVPLPDDPPHLSAKSTVHIFLPVGPL